MDPAARDGLSETQTAAAAKSTADAEAIAAAAATSTAAAARATTGTHAKAHMNRHTCQGTHAKADQDAFAALADLLAHEIAIQSFRLINMLESADPHDGHELWNSRIFFPNSDKTGQRVQQLTALLNKVTKGVSGWDKDKRTGLLRKTATGIALGAGADADGLNRHMGWKPDDQSRSYAVADLAAHLQEQAGLAGFDCHNDI